MRRLYLIIISLCLGGIIVSAQDIDYFKRQRNEAFQSFKKKSQEKIETFRKKANAEFSEYLKKTWKRETLEPPLPVPDKEPDVPPVVLPTIDMDVPEDNLIDVNINFPRLDAQPTRIEPVPYRPKPAEKRLTFTFYGTTSSVRFDTAKAVSLNGSDENAVSRFWRDLSGEAYDNVIADCQAIREERDLSDWAYYKMTEKVAETLFGTQNERRVFLAWLLAQSGISIRLGRDGENLHLMLGVSDLLFGKTQWEKDGVLFFVADNDRVDAMYVMDATFPGTSPVRMRMKARNVFEVDLSSGRILKSARYPSAEATVSCNKNLIAYLEDLPITAIGKTGDVDFARYAETPLSAGAEEGLYAVLKQQITGKSEEDAANLLLNFVQTAFAYKTDVEVWGRERPFSPEETLYYPYCDCEDRAILFCRLIRDLMGLDAAFVSYPGHLATAVCFTQDISGDYFLVKGKKYVVCDPTYINAPIGRTMLGMDNKTAQVFLF